MDAQAQDRCHRIGQTREVHIYRLIRQGGGCRALVPDLGNPPQTQYTHLQTEPPLLSMAAMFDELAVPPAALPGLLWLARCGLQRHSARALAAAGVVRPAFVGARFEQDFERFTKCSCLQLSLLSCQRPPTAPVLHSAPFSPLPCRSEHTIEENILKKSDQKRQLDFLAIQASTWPVACGDQAAVGRLVLRPSRRGAA